MKLIIFIYDDVSCKGNEIGVSISGNGRFGKRYIQENGSSYNSSLDLLIICK
jgi:hypothetical protein